MLVANSITQARQRVLQQGIQQTNRYAFYFPRLTGNERLALYPFSVVLPGYGFDLLDHSIWSTVRKIPFRKNYTDLQVTFIVGATNYKNFITLWDRVYVTKQNKLTSPYIEPIDDAFNRGDYFGSVQNQGVLSGTGLAQLALGVGQVVEALVRPDAYNTILTSNSQYNTVTGLGGATNYVSNISTEVAEIHLLNNDSYGKTSQGTDTATQSGPKANTVIKFNSAFVSQISPVQLTSVDTGYTTFTASLKFATIECY